MPGMLKIIFTRLIIHMTVIIIICIVQWLGVYLQVKLCDISLHDCFSVFVEEDRVSAVIGVGLFDESGGP